jgi:hypothetical protein
MAVPELREGGVDYDAMAEAARMREQELLAEGDQVLDPQIRFASMMQELSGLNPAYAAGMAGQYEFGRTDDAETLRRIYEQEASWARNNRDRAYHEGWLQRQRHANSVELQGLRNEAEGRYVWGGPGNKYYMDKRTGEVKYVGAGSADNAIGQMSNEDLLTQMRMLMSSYGNLYDKVDSASTSPIIKLNLKLLNSLKDEAVARGLLEEADAAGPELDDETAAAQSILSDIYGPEYSRYQDPLY